MSIENLKLGFAVPFVSSQYGYLGAVLITDYKGFPLEFRYTDPVVPTKIQQVLYGKELDTYLKVDVIIDSLFKVISNKIDILLVQDEDLLRYRESNVDIVRISPTNIPPLSEIGELVKTKDYEYLLQTAHSKNPIRLQFQDDFDCEGEVFASIIDSLTITGDYIDIEEPLNRVFKTIELICNKEI